MNKNLLLATVLFLAVSGATLVLVWSLRQEQQQEVKRSASGTMPATVQEFSAPTPQDVFVQDPKMGAHGEVEMRLEGKTILWPEQYALRSLEAVNLGVLPEAGDNGVLWEVSITRKDAPVLSRIEFGERMPFSDISYDPLYDPFQRPGKYAFRGVFYEKSNPSQIAEGILGFETTP